jgi:glycosyl transferase family 25
MSGAEGVGGLELAVISLPSAQERRRRIDEQLRGFPVPWSVFEARTALPTGLQYDERGALIHRGRPMRPGELGAFASHYECLREFVDRSAARYRLVLEDDVFLDPGFPYGRLPVLMAGCGIEYLRLHATFIRPCSVLAYLGQYRQLVRFHAPTYGACAYVMSKSGAQRFLGSLGRVVRPVDDELDRFWHNGLPAYAIFPGPALELYGGTTVGAPERDFRSGAAAPPSLHAAHRLGERLRRALANALLAGQDRRVAGKAAELLARQVI